MSRCYWVESKNLKRVRFAMGYSRIEAKHLQYVLYNGERDGPSSSGKTTKRKPVKKWTFVKRKKSNSRSIQEPPRDNYELRVKKAVKYCSSSSTGSCGPIDVENDSPPNSVSPQSHSNNDGFLERTMEHSKADDDGGVMQEIEDKYAANMRKIKAIYAAEVESINDKRKENEDKHRAEMARINAEYSAEMERINDKHKVRKEQLQQN